MKRPDYIPEDYNGIKMVDSFEAMLSEPFGHASAVLLPRSLSGDFNALAQVMGRKGYWRAPLMRVEKRDDLRKNFPQEIDLLREDIRMLRGVSAQHYLDLRVSKDSNWREDRAPHAFHSDGCRNAHFGRVLCCYNDPVTEWIRREDAIPRDSHEGTFEKREGAPLYRFKAGDIWRLASRTGGDGNVCGRPLFIHRTPPSIRDRKEEDPPRMVLVAG